jgi:3',5'-cyclic-AMP phosphodiesterase
MSHVEPRRLFQPQPPDAAGVVSWVHIGDLHMTKAGERNHIDLTKIVDEINNAFAQSVSFVFLPGDIADDGSRAAFAVVRREIDRLKVPWCAIVGDHDVHEKSFSNFLDAMADRTHYSFAVGKVRFVAMNAFDVADPGSFVVDEDQLAWSRQVLQTGTDAGETKILLLHCYPSDLKAGGD